MTRILRNVIRLPKKGALFFLKEAFLPPLEPYLVRRLYFGISTNREPYDVVHIWGPVDEWIVFLFRRLNKIRITQKAILIQSNLFITDTKGTGIGVRIIEVSVLER